MARTGGALVVRNTVFLLVAQACSLLLGLPMIWIVPRSVGAAEWGEWTLAWALTSILSSLAALGLDTLLIREMSRTPEDSSRLLGAAVTARLLLALAYSLILAGITAAAHYPPHTRTIVAVVGASALVTFIATPAYAGLIAHQRMFYNSLGNLITSGLVSLAALLLVKVFALGMVAISFASLAGALAAAALQYGAVSRVARVRLSGDFGLVARLLRGALPFWASSIFVTFYVWIDSLLLSFFTSTTEVGWYGAAGKLLATLGILPFAVNMAVFPEVSRGFRQDVESALRVTRTSVRLVMTLGVPMVVGLVAVGPPLVIALYGWSFAPAGPILSVLALTLLPIFFATVVNGTLIAADRQVAWTVVMAGCCVLNPLLNALFIPAFEAAHHNGALGAAWALVVTDGLVGLCAVVMLPAAVRKSLASVVPAVLKSAAAASLMWLLVMATARQPVVARIIVGVLAFIAAALALRVFRAEDVELLRKAFRRLGLRAGRATGIPEAGSAAVEPEVLPGPAPTSAASVVICTRDRPETLGAALDAVLNQTHPDYEVVIVDQSKGDETEALVRERQANWLRLRYQRLPSTGLSVARNAGVGIAEGAIVAFTDDDCIAPPDWLCRIESAFAADPDAELLYGQVFPAPELASREGIDGVTPMLLFERRALLRPPHGFRVFGMGANSAFRRSAFDRIGGYDEALGAGGLLRGGEDFDFSFRVFRSGGAILLEPDVVVEHHGFRPRQEWPETVRGYGIGVGSFYLKHIRSGDALAAWMAVKMLIRECGGVLRKRALRRPSGAQAIYVAHVLKGMRISAALTVRRRLYVVPGQGG